MTLDRRAGSWRVLDLVYDREPLGPGFFPVDARLPEHGVVLVVATLMSYKGHDCRPHRFEPESGALPVIDATSATLVDRGGGEHAWRNGVAVAGSGDIFVPFQRVDGKPAVLRVDVRRRGVTGRGWTYDLRF